LFSFRKFEMKIATSRPEHRDDRASGGRDGSGGRCWRIFNSNPDFIDDSEGRIGKFRVQARRSGRGGEMFRQPLRANQTVLCNPGPGGAHRRVDRDGRYADRLIRAANYAALGLLIMDREWQGSGGLVARVADAIEIDCSRQSVGPNWNWWCCRIGHARGRFWERCGLSVPPRLD